MDIVPIAPQVARPAQNRAVRALSSFPNYHIVLVLGLALTFIAYCGTLAFDFVYDDRSQIISNPWLHSWRFVPRYFTVQVWGFHNPYSPGNYYRPLFLLWLRASYALFGLRPWGWHLASVLAHLGVTLLVYFLAARITRDRFTAALAAMVFGVHPVHIESVAWLSAVTEPSLALPFISSFLCYLKYRDRQTRAGIWLVASLLLYAVAMLAKETALVLPALIFAYEWIFWPEPAESASTAGRSRRIRNAMWSAGAFLALIPFYLLARWMVLKGFSHAVTPLPLSTILLTWPSLLWLYVKLLVWPVGLSPAYNTPYVTSPGFFGFILPAAAVTSAAFILWTWARRGRGKPAASSASRSRAIAFASVWLLVPMFPLFNLSVFLIGDIVHDRYLYLPSVGFAIMAALALRELRVTPGKLLGVPAFQVLSALVLTILFTLGTVFQSLMWTDDLLLYSRGVQVAPHNRNIKMNLANVACERGLYSSGIALYKEVIRDYPDFWAAYYNLGYTYYRMGSLEEADRYLSQAANVDLLRSDVFLYLGLTRMKMGRLNEAVPLLRHAAEAAPEGAPIYHLALGIALKAQGDLKGALEEFKSELSVDPQEQAARDQITEIETHLRPIPSTIANPDVKR